MGIELKMPALSPTMEEGTLAKWLVKEGDAVKSGDILAEIETDKATMEFEAVDEGTIAKILVPEGTDGVKVGQPIALLAGEGEEIAPSPQRGEGRGERAQPSPDKQGPAHQPSPDTGEGVAKVTAPESRRGRRPRMCSKRRRATSSPMSPRPTTIPKCPKGRR